MKPLSRLLGSLNAPGLTLGMFEQAQPSTGFPATAPRRFSSFPETPAGVALFLGGLCLAAFLLWAAIFAAFRHSPAALSGNLAAFFLYRQDFWLLLAGFLSLLAAGSRLGAGNEPLRLDGARLAGMAVALLAFCYLGRYLILSGYDLTRDEQLANFDAAVLAKGLLAQPLPPPWQVHADALNTMFMLPVSKPAAWVSAYLPMNAALRALVGLVADPALTGPVLTALGLVALWKCARLLWPGEREPAVVAALLYCASGQILLSGMTSYAMTAHLTLNLLWLWLFLLDRRGADMGALAVAFVATGLHQPLFHPLFAAPFLFGLLRDRAWLRVALYAAGYAAICAFWLAWPLFVHGLVAGPASVSARTGTDFFSRLMQILASGGSARWFLMTANLLRFFAWQPVLLLPLMVAALVLARRERPTLALAASAGLPILVMLVVLPYQGHGFGYRYLQPALGSALLLAAQGWRSLVGNRVWLRALTRRAALIPIFTVLPLQLWFAHDLYAASAQVDARIKSAKADFVIVGSRDSPFAVDLVLNRPDLSNRPLRLLADFLDDDLIGALCRDGAPAALPQESLYQPIGQYFGAQPDETARVRRAMLASRLKAAGCNVINPWSDEAEQ